MHADIYRHIHKNTPEPYPPGMILKLPSNNEDSAGYTTDTVSSIPIFDSAGDSVPTQYLL